MPAFSTRAELLQPGLDNLTAFMASMPGNNVRARNSALSSIGYQFKMRAKETVKLRYDSLGWPKLSTATPLIRVNPDVALGNKPYPEIKSGTGETFGRKLWGSLANLLVYSLEKESGVLLMGFQSGTYGMKTVTYTRSDGSSYKRKIKNVISGGIVEIARRLTEGYEFVVEQQMQRYFFALGIRTRIGQTIKLPPRPLVSKVWLQMAPQVPQMFADKFWERMRIYSGETGKTIEKVFN